MTLRENPYRLFFPISWLGALLLSAVWIPAIAVQRRWLALPDGSLAYPRDLHAMLAAGVFILPAMTGFILTAFPRMVTVPEGALAWAVSLFLVEILAIPAALLGGFGGVIALSCAILFAFTIQTLRRSIRPPSYVFLICSGLATGILGGILWLLFPGERSGSYVFLYGMIPQILLAAGAMLVVPVSGSANRLKWRERLMGIPRWMPVVVALGFWLSAAANAAALPFADLPAVAAAWLWMLRYFHLQDFREFKGVIAWSFLIASLCFAVGFTLHAAWPAAAVHAVHLYWIGGLSLFLSCVMVQVTLSHGGHAMSPLPGKRTLYWTLGLIILAALTRVSARIMESTYVSHLSYAGLVFFIAWCLWLFRFSRYLGSAKSPPENKGAR